MKVTLILLLLFLTGCGTIKVSRETFKTQGVLTGQISIGNEGITKIKIGKVTFRFENEEGFFAIPLNPGEHKISLIQKQFGGVTTSYPVDRNITIRKGRISSMGQAFVLKDDVLIQGFQPPDEALTAKVYFYDNPGDVIYFLQNTFPEILGVVQPKDVIRSPGHYLSHKELHDLRMNVFNRSLNAKPSKVDPKQRIFTGDLGTIVIYNVNGANKIVGPKVISNDSLGFPKCVSYKYGYGACLKQTNFKENKLLAIKNQRAKQYDIPPEVTIDSLLEVLDDSFYVFMNPDFFFYFTFNHGEKWRPYRKFMIPSNVGFQLKTLRSPNGLYIYAPESPKAQLIYIPYDGKAFSSIPLADDLATDHLSYSKEGLFFGPHKSFFGSETIHFKNHGKKNWQKFELPEKGCEFSVSPADQKSLKLKCEEKTFNSDNNGLTWKAI